jgi:hypothetical protein
MSATLTPCSSCSRHVRRTERACPFCGSTLVLAAAPLRVVGERLGRAAIFSIGAAAITSVGGCGAKSELSIGSPPTVQTDAAIAHDMGQIFSSYGGPTPVHDAGAPSTHYGGPPHDAAFAVEDDVGAVGVLYGGPELTPDGGADVDAGCSNADYGAPPWEPPCP